MTRVQGMTSNWSTAACHAAAFAYNLPLGRRSFQMSARESAASTGDKGPQVGNLSLPQLGKEETEARLNASFYLDIIHLFSLLHAVSVQDLRLDLDLNNLIEYQIDAPECNPGIDSNLEVGFDALSTDSVSRDWSVFESTEAGQKDDQETGSKSALRWSERTSVGAVSCRGIFRALFAHFSSRIWAVYCSRMKIGVIGGGSQGSAKVAHRCTCTYG